jgi:hypothetical protein
MNGCTLALVPLEPVEALVVATVIPVVAVDVVVVPLFLAPSMALPRVPLNACKPTVWLCPASVTTEVAVWV